MRGYRAAATFNNGERIQSEVNGACIEPIHLFSRGLTKVSKYLFLPSTLYRRASCKAWPEPIGHISFFGEIDSWHAPFKKSICLVKLKNVFRTNRRATTKQWIMNWRRRAEKGERVVLQQKVIHPLTFSLFSFYSGTQRFACESIIDALTIIENQCSIKTLLLFYFNQQQ